ncbi:MAG: hypothetical protein M3Z01_04705 [Thermoproteota archaeon]|nr:hypothetical protein [Thermoproteota archaeon]
MININLKKTIKKWIPIFGIISLIVIIIAVIFHSSFPQIISSIIVSVLLIFSAMFFRSVGRDRESGQNNSDVSKSDHELK